jgi:predicted nucleic acid-binding protein
MSTIKIGTGGKAKELTRETYEKWEKEMGIEKNVYDKIMDYDDFYFSLNKGDYMKPIV